jgi:hypothetical protein
MRNISFFKAPISNVIPEKEITLLELSDLIRNNYASQTENLRNATNEHLKASLKNSQFDYVTFSGTFSTRSKDNLIQQSGYIGIDIDKISNLDEIRERIINFNKISPVMVFTSVSGNGLRAVYKCEYDIQQHEEVFNLLKDIFDYHLNIKIDESGKDISRASYICNDDHIYYNNELDGETGYTPEYLGGLLKQAFKVQVKKYATNYVISKISKAVDGNKANTLFKVAVHMGDLIAKNLIDESFVQDLIKSEILKRNLNSEKQAIKIINDGLTKGKRSSNFDIEKLYEIVGGNSTYIEELENHLKEFSSLNSKEFYSKIKERLPIKLTEYLDQYPTSAEKEIALLSLIAGLSSSLSFVKFDYRKKYYYPMLNLIIMGNAGSNKSMMRIAEEIVEDLDTYFQDKHENSVGFNIGGNFSYAALVNAIYGNGGTGLIFDTEADIMTANSKNDWGSFNGFIRKCFGHEKEKVLRKNDKPIIIHLPMVTVIISGTFDQILAMFPNDENGFFSRFMFYNASNEEIGWVSSEEYINFDNSFLKSFKNQFYDFYKDHINNEVEFKISENLLKRHDEFFKDWMENLKDKKFNFNQSIIFRLAIMTFRIAVTLDAFDKINSGVALIETEEISEKNFSMALDIIDQMIRYSLNLSMNLSSNKKKKGLLNLNELDFVQTMKNRFHDFTRAEAVAVAKQFGIRDRKADEILADGRWFIRNSQGKYIVK